MAHFGGGDRARGVTGLCSLPVLREFTCPYAERRAGALPPAQSPGQAEAQGGAAAVG